MVLSKMGQHEVLESLKMRGGIATNDEISQDTGHKKDHISNIVGKLRRQGLIKPGYCIVLTEAYNKLSKQ